MYLCCVKLDCLQLHQFSQTCLLTDFFFFCRSNQRSTCNAHRKVGRSRSHRPRVNESANAVSTLPDGMTGMQVNNNSVGIISDHRGYTTHETSSNPQNFSDKPVLRKHHSFPYEMFNNETSYSSDDSMKQY